jgi:hypothetical protein
MTKPAQIASARASFWRTEMPEGNDIDYLLREPLDTIIRKLARLDLEDLQDWAIRKADSLASQRQKR